MADPIVVRSASSSGRSPEPALPASGSERPRLPSRAELAELFARAQNQVVNGVGIEIYNRLIGQRVVNTYGQFSGYSQAERERAAAILDRRLDTRGPAVFHADTAALLSDPAVLRYLTELRSALQAATPQSPVSLWSFTLQRAGSEREATRWLATLLQDYTPEVLRGLGVVRYIEDARGKAVLLETLKAVAAGVHGGTLSPYPPGVALQSNTFYHYYVPRHLAQLLVDEGVPRNLAFLTAGTFNLEYELMAPALLDQRHDGVLREVAGVFSRVTGVSQAQLEAHVAALRQSGSANNEFMFADLDFEQDLHLTPEQLARFLDELTQHHGLGQQARDAFMTLPEKTLHRITQALTALQFARFTRDPSVSGVLENLLKPGYTIYQNGVDRPVMLSPGTVSDAFVGFAGAASVLPGGRPPFPEQVLSAGLVRMGPKPFMGRLYERMGPTAGDALAARLQPTAQNDPRGAVSAIASLYATDPAQGRSALEQLLQHHADPRALARRLLGAGERVPETLARDLRGTALVGLDPPAARDATFARLRTLSGRDSAQVAVGIIDQAFDPPSRERLAAPNRPRHGIDLVDRDDDPYARISQQLSQQHGTPVMDLATRGTDALVPVPIRSTILHVDAAIDHAARSGARVVNISQEMVAARAEDLEVFRQALRRHPDVLVVMAAGNRGTAVGAIDRDLAAIDEPNFVKVAAATFDGHMSRRSSFSASHVQFVARGGTQEIPILGDRNVTALVAAMRRPHEATSHGAPTVANIAAKVRLLAPHLTAAQVVALLGEAATANEILAPQSQYGVIDPELALATAATLALTRDGSSAEQALQQIGDALQLAGVALERLRRSVAALSQV